MDTSEMLGHHQGFIEKEGFIRKRELPLGTNKLHFKTETSTRKRTLLLGKEDSISKKKNQEKETPFRKNGAI